MSDTRPGLTPPMRAILPLIAEGLSNAQIGRRLGRSENTVKTHIRLMFQRLGAKDRAHAVAIGFRRGHLRIADPLVEAALDGLRDLARWEAGA